MPPREAAAVKSPDFDERGNPRRQRRTVPLWLWFAGFWVVVALVAAATLMFTGASVPGHGPAPSGLTASAPSGPVVSGSGASSTGSVVSPGASSTAVSNRPVLTVNESPPSAPAGTNGTFRVQFIPASNCTLTRTYVPGATPGPPPTPKSPVTSVAFSVGSDGWSPPIAWGQNAQAGTYTIIATCDEGAQPSATVTFTWK